MYQFRKKKKICFSDFRIKWNYFWVTASVLQRNITFFLLGGWIYHNPVIANIFVTVFCEGKMCHWLEFTFVSELHMYKLTCFIIFHLLQKCLYLFSSFKSQPVYCPESVLWLFFFLLNFEILLFFFFGKKIEHLDHFCNIVLEGPFGVSEIRFPLKFSVSEMYRGVHFVKCQEHHITNDQYNPGNSLALKDCIFKNFYFA